MIPSVCANTLHALRAMHADPTCEMTYPQAFQTCCWLSQWHRVDAVVEARVMFRVPVTCVAVLLCLLACTPTEGVFVSFEVQLAISDDSFSSFGTIYGDVEENVSIRCSCLCFRLVVGSLLVRFEPRRSNNRIPALCFLAAFAVQQVDLGQARVLTGPTQTVRRSGTAQRVSIVLLVAA